MRQHARAQRGLLLGRPAPEALAALHAQPPLRDQLLEVGDAFGLNALLSGPNGSRLEAVDAVTLLVLSDEVLRGIMASMPSVARALTGETAPSVAPEGGQRLSRMTMSVRASDLAAVIAGAAGTMSGAPGSAPLALGNAGTPQALAEAGRRLTGSFPTVPGNGPG